MASIQATRMKKGMLIKMGEDLFRVLDLQHVTPGNLRGFVRVKMRNLITRAVFDKTFKAGEKFVEPDLMKVEATYLYTDASGFNFMDQGTFETLTLSADELGDDRFLITDNLLVQVLKYNGQAIAVQLPPHVELTVTMTEPGVRGDTASGGVTKPATLETGLEIRVPLFVKEGERVKVHTETREFAGRA